MKLNEESILDLVLAVWKRRKWMGIVSFLMPFTLAVGVIAFLPSIYRSTATVLVDRQQVPEAFVRPTVTSGLETRLQTISQEVFSRARLDAIINRFQLYDDLKKRVAAEEVIERMRSDIQLEYRGVDRAGQRGTIAFAVSYRGKDPLTVAQVTNTLASFFIEENLKVRERQAAGTAEFLKVQLAEVKVKLDTQEKQVSQFKRRNLVDLPQQAAVNLGMIDRLDTQLRANIDSQTRLAERRELLAKRASQVAEFVPGPVAPAPLVTRDGSTLPGGPSPLQLPVLVDPAAAELLRLQQELRNLRSRFSDKYPDVVRVNTEIAALERHREETDGASVGESAPRAQKPEGELEVLKKEEKRLQEAIATYQRRVDNVPKREQDLQKLTRDYAAIKELYASLSKRYEEAQLAETLERQKGGQFRILDPAIPPNEPVGPNRIRLILMGLILCLTIAAGAVVLAEQMDTSFHRVDEFWVFTNLPVLASVPRIVTRADTRRDRLRFSVVTVLAGLGLILIMRASYLLGHVSEQLVWMLAQRGA